jgi:hypothetical protein
LDRLTTADDLDQPDIDALSGTAAHLVEAKALMQRLNEWRDGIPALAAGDQVKPPLNGNPLDAEFTIDGEACTLFGELLSVDDTLHVGKVSGCQHCTKGQARVRQVTTALYDAAKLDGGAA